MISPPLQKFGSLAPIVPGYSVFGRCWEDAISITFKGVNAANNDPVILRMSKARRLDDDHLSPLMHDFDICGKTTSRAVAKPLDFVNVDGLEYLVLPDSGTQPLSELLLHQRLPFGRSLELFVEIANGLGELHRDAIVHCNINPHTIWVNDELRDVVLTDFSRATFGSNASAERQLEGSFQYIAPEQTGRIAPIVDARADLYSTGVVAYHLFCGQPPFAEIDPLELIHSHLARTPTPPHVINPQIPPVLSDILTKLLSKAPDERYQTAAGLKSDLQECLTQWHAHGHIHHFKIGESDVFTVFQISNKLYGRDAELTTLRAALTRAKHGSTELVLISGAPGIGKSLLAQTIQPDIRTRGAFVSGKFDQYKQNEPYSVIAQAFRNLIEHILCSSQDRIRDWRERVIQALGLNAHLVVGVVPELEDLIGRQGSPPNLPASEKQHRFNHAFRQFVKVFASPDHPLCLFLDDLQWADPASLSLLQTLLTDTQISHFLIMGAFRPAIESGDDNIAQYIRRISQSDVPITRISLLQLEVPHISNILRDSLHCSSDEAAPFAELVKIKTDGNPFFITQFLSFLNHQRLIEFDFAQNRWTWDLRRIAAEGVTDNVLELMNRKLVDLPCLVQETMKIAACIANRFSVSALSVVMGEPLGSIQDTLILAEREGLIVSDRDADNQGYFRFLHDRIQQAAYALVPESSRPAMRLQIGRRLLAELPQAERDIGNFVIMDNLNAARDLIQDGSEQECIAQLNAIAGRRAREIAAFDAALGYFRYGMELLPSDGWDRLYDLTLDLHLGRFECAYVIGCVEEANSMFVAILNNSGAANDKARAYYLKILLNTGMDRSEEAVAVGLEALGLFKEEVPKRPTKLQLFRKLTAVVLRLRGRRAKDLLQLPRMTDVAKKATVTLLMSICPAAYFRNPDLMVFAALRIVSISLRYGNAPASSFGYVLYGLARGALFGDYRGGHEFGRLAVELAKLDADPAQQCKILTIFAGWLNFWREPIDDSVRILTSSFKLALEAGDVQYAHYSALQIMFLRFTRGVPLDDLRKDITHYQPAIEQAADWFTRTTYTLRRQFIKALQNQTTSWNCLDDDQFIEEPVVSELRAIGNLTALAYYLIAKAQLAYLFDSLADARRYSDESETQIMTVVNQIVIVEHYFYRGLISAALIRQNAEDKRVLWRNLKKAAAKLERFEINCPSNFASHHRLLRAEIARLSGEVESATDWFDEAAKLAREQGFHQVEAIANELAAENCLARKRDHVAKMYLLAARQSFRRWGSLAKVSQISAKYGVFLGQEGAEPKTAWSSQHLPTPNRGDVIDLDTVMRATIDLSADLESDRLLNKLMRLILECMGGERAFIISKQNDVLHIEAAGSTDGTQVLLFHELDNNQSQFSESIVNYVLHTGRQLLLQDARTDARFQTCPYMITKGPRSIACIPLAKVGTVLGVAYVENALISGAFSEDRMRGLVLLSQQVFSAIENIRLQTQLSQNTKSLQMALQDVELLSGIRGHLAKFVPKSIQKLIEDNPENPDFATREEDVSILFLDIAGSTSMSEQLGSEELKRIIETYFSSFIDDVTQNGGDINEVAGDGLMIIFQDPSSSEHAKKATRTAISIRETTAKLNGNSGGRWPPVVINIGIHSGVSLIGASKIESASGTRWVYTATGYVANVAARIGSAASNGAILVSEATANRLGSEFDLVERGGQIFKGVSHPINVFSVSGKRPS
jgi:predicted ATPase/class 3 adenylate cyclase